MSVFAFALVVWEARLVVATSARRVALVVIDRVTVRDREIDAVRWVHPYRVFWERQRECPQGDSNP